MSETVARKSRKTIESAANSGDRRRLLVALRNLVAKSLDSGAVPPRDLAALTKRLADISREIEDIDKASGKDDPVVQALEVEDESFG